LLQRFAQIIRASAQLIQQSSILDGDDGLRGKIPHQLDLPVGEGPDFLTIDDNAPHQRIVLEHGYCEVRSRAPQPRQGRWPSCVVGGVDHVSRLP
jgi:hypothetical protein